MEQHNYWYYLGRVSLAEAWPVLKQVITGTLFLSIFTLFIAGILEAIYYFLGSAFLVSQFSDFSNSLPWWITAPIIFSLFLWFGRGQRIVVPNFDFTLWLCFTPSHDSL